MSEITNTKSQTWGLLTIATLGYYWYDVELPTEDSKIQEIQKALAPFFDKPFEDITQEEITEHVKGVNQLHPKYAIDPEKDLLEEVQLSKQKMVGKGEKSFYKGFGTYILYNPKLREMAMKIQNLTERGDSYEKDMINCFKFFNEK